MKHLIALLIVGILSSCTNNMGQDHSKANELINESSPYLLQHAYNPVNWKPWSQKALDQAGKESKLVIVSIGYAACHWCHVMEHESFEDSLIAKKMNDNFISIKVDREERPDIDQIYMEAAQLMTGRGGWPLNVITLPNGKPVFAGTYFPKDNWEKVLDYFSEMYVSDPQKLIDQAEKVTAGIQENEMPSFNEAGNNFSIETTSTINESLLSNIDFEYGGRKGAPKFPMPVIYEYLLTQDYHQKDVTISKALKTTLDRIADGGIYDHLGGGFSRYSTDEKWTVPHFEKMLYDNGQLISLYAHAYQYYGDQKYEQTVKETIAFCKRELMDETGMFYSSLDADSEGVEGKFYVWNESEIDDALGTDTELFKSYYGISKKGNFEHKNILERKSSTQDIAEKFNISEESVITTLAISKEKLMSIRDTRIRPGLDDKALTAWNGLMIIGLLDAYASFGEADYLNDAIKTASFISDNQIQADGLIFRNYKDGKSSINGFLDDYAITALAFIKLYESTFDEKWLLKAKSIKGYVDQHFSDKKTKMYFYTSNLDEELIARKMELADNVIPGSNSVMANVLILLGQYFYNEADIERAEQMIANTEANFSTYPYFYSNWARLYQLIGETHYEVAVVGPDAEKIRLELAKKYIPNKILLGGPDEGSLELLKGKSAGDNTFIYVCQNKSCQLPARDVEVALKQLKVNQ
ncbi:MAG: thioredoxin domain-containing protein [Reichenbachiella sp.]